MRVQQDRADLVWAEAGLEGAAQAHGAGVEVEEAGLGGKGNNVGELLTITALS